MGPQLGVVQLLEGRQIQRVGQQEVVDLVQHKPEFTPHVDTGDFIVVVNAARLRVTGAKSQDKKYYRHSGYPGGISETTFGKMQERFPGRALEKAVRGMLPKGPLGYAMLKKLKVYAEGSHPHTAQQPKTLDI